MLMPHARNPVSQPLAGHQADKEHILAAMKLANFDVRYGSVKSDDIDHAFEKKTDLIVIAGGDGTITEVLTQVSDQSIPVALLPLGSANNVALSLGIAGMPQELVETWKIDRIHALDVGMVKSSWGTSRFLEGFGVGLFADADKREKARVRKIFAKGANCLKSTLKRQSPRTCRSMWTGNYSKANFLALKL
jgi:diacylglycerol kinase family enzyme